jgi:hypothetical protein
MRSANAAAVALRSQPAYVSYRALVHATEGSHRIDETMRVVVRTDDDSASITYGDGMRAQAHAAPGVPPTFDFLADFYFSYDFTGTHAALVVDYDRERTFTPTVGPAEANVVVANVRGYDVQYAANEPSGTVRLALRRLDGVSARRDPIQTFLGFSAVDFDAATGLPKRVAFTGLDNAMTADYAVVQGIPVLAHFTFSATTYDKRKQPNISTYDATYTDVAFSPAPPAS